MFLCICTNEYNSRKFRFGEQKKQIHYFLTGKLREAWEKLYKTCDGIIFVLDSSDPLRLAVAKEELALTLCHEDLEQKPVPILFLSNKMDLSDAIGCDSCTKALGLSDIRDRRWRIYSSNALTGEGLTEAIGWFTGEVQNCMNRKKLVI